MQVSVENTLSLYSIVNYLLGKIIDWKILDDSSAFFQIYRLKCLYPSFINCIYVAIFKLLMYFLTIPKDEKNKN